MMLIFDHKVCKTHVKTYHIDRHQQTMLNNCCLSLSQQPQAFHDVKKFTSWKWMKSSGRIGAFACCLKSASKDSRKHNPKYMKQCRGQNIEMREYLIPANEHGFELTWNKGWKKKGWVLQSLWEQFWNLQIGIDIGIDFSTRKVEK